MRTTVAVALACLFFCTVAAQAAVRRRVVAPPWSAALKVEKTGQQTAGGRSIYSSGSAVARWNPPAVTFDHYVVTAIETAGGAPLSYDVARTATSTTLTALESGTEYRFTIRACFDAACSSSITSSSEATLTTEEEYWQIRGTGSSYSGAERIVSDGNTKPYTLLWGTEAGPALAGRAQLYYDPSGSDEKGVKIGTLSAPITASASAVSHYTGLSGYGFRRIDSQGKAGIGPATFQVVALSQRLGSKVRLYYEAAASDGHGRIYSVDSTDGWVGRDFHSGTATQCQEADLAAGGACQATLLIGVESDGNPKLREARQFKIGLPTMNGWTWDGEPGTFMVVTIHLTDSTCSSTFFNMGYAIWDGTRWNLQYGPDGCPKLIPGVQAPLPVHVGGSRYKLYFNNNASLSGGTSSGSFKPVRLLYADGSSTGQSSLVDFEDWESIGRARRVNVLWPSGALLTDQESSMFDDYHVWMPTNDPSFQVIYSNMSCPDNACGPPFIGMAVLLNP